MAQNKSESKAALSTNNVIAIAACSALIVVLASVFIVNNLVRKVIYNNRVLAKKTVASKQLEANVQAVAELADKYEQLGGRITLVMDALPTKPDFPSIVAMTEAMAGASGVKLKSVNTALDSSIPVARTASPTSAVVAPSGMAVPLPFIYSVTVSGAYDNIVKFLSTLEISSRPVVVQSISQSGTSADQSVDLRLQTYYQAPADTTLKTEVVK